MVNPTSKFTAPVMPLSLVEKMAATYSELAPDLSQKFGTHLAKGAESAHLIMRDGNTDLTQGHSH